MLGALLCLLRSGGLTKIWARASGLPRLYLVGCGMLFTGYSAAIYMAIGLAKDRGQVLEVALINYLWPALTILFSIPILGKRARIWLVPGTLLALAGVFLVMTQGEQVSWTTCREHLRSNPWAYALALAAAVSWGLYSNVARRWAGQGSDGAVELFLLATGLVLLALRSLMGEVSFWTNAAVGEAFALALLTTVSYALWDIAARKGNLLLVAAASYFTPLLSTLVSCAYLGVSPSSQLWLGCLLLVGGSLITWRSVADA